MKKLIIFYYLFSAITAVLILSSCSNYPSYNLYNSKLNKYHVVRSGETLHSIAKENDIEVERLAKLNHLKFPYIITTGQRINLPSFSYYTYLKERQNKEKQLASSRNNKVTEKVFLINPLGIKDEPQKTSKNVNNSWLVAPILPKTMDKKLPKIVPREQVQPKNTPKNITANKDWIWPAKGKVVNKFGIKGPHNSKGISILGKKGDPIRATANGKVVYSGSNLQGYGNLIIIKHNQDFLSAYAHNEKILVTEQQEVKQGQEIATMGDSDAKNVLLHFEIRYKGKPIDPLKILA